MAKWVPSFGIGFDRIETTNPVRSKNILKQKEKHNIKLMQKEPRYHFCWKLSFVILNSEEKEKGRTLHLSANVKRAVLLAFIMLGAKNLRYCTPSARLNSFALQAALAEKRVRDSTRYARAESAKSEQGSREGYWAHSPYYKVAQEAIIIIIFFSS